MNEIRSLVLGCGPNWPRRPAPHVETYVDRLDLPGIDLVCDLDDTPWPIASSWYDEIVAIHLVEHLKNLTSFMDECWRVLAPGGQLYLVTPEAGSDWDLTHADPTHVRCYRKHTWINYFTRGEGPKFCYTQNYWAILDIRTVDNCIHLLASPIKPT